MKNYEIETLTSAETYDKDNNISMTCSPGWCGPVDGYIDDNYEDKKYLDLKSLFKSVI